jgi:membrane protease YdiL (CAAX protease family)
MDTNDSGYKYVVKEVPVTTNAPPSSDDLGMASLLAKRPRSSPAVILAELVAVLAIGVIPYCCGSCVLLSRLDEPAPAVQRQWVDKVYDITRWSCVTTAVLFVIYRTGEPFSQFGLTRPRWLDLPIGCCLFGFFVLTCSLLTPLFDPAMFRPGNVAQPPLHALDCILIVMWAIAGVLSEEVVNRSYLVTRLEHLSHSKGVALVLSSMFFASYHIYQGLPGLCIVFVFGLQAAGCFLYTRRIWPVVTGHLLYNLRIDFQILI